MSILHLIPHFRLSFSVVKYRIGLIGENCDRKIFHDSDV